MPLDPKAKIMLETMKKMGIPAMNTQSVEEARKSMARMARANMIPSTQVASVCDRVIPGPGDLPIRIYLPEGMRPFPILIYFHGGGFVFGNIDSHDPVCRDLCAGADCMVISVDYRLAPEHKFPAATDDCLTAARWVAKHALEIGGDPARIAIGGDSAGANLATVTSLHIRDEGGPFLCGQLLIYPCTDNSRFDTPSWREYSDGYFLSREDALWTIGHYLKDRSDGMNPYASPLLAPDLRGLPPALVITAEFDPLLDEGERYAERLKEAGVPTVLTRYSGMIHGFFQMPMFDQAKQALDEVCTWLKNVFKRHGLTEKK